MKVVNSKTFGFAFFWNFYEFISNLQACWFGKGKEKMISICAKAPGRSFLLAERPLAGVWSRGAAGGRIPAPGAAGGEGEHGEKQEGGARNLVVALVGRGAAWGGFSAEQGRRRVLGHGGGSPVRQGGDGRAQEHLWGERVPFPGSIGAGGGRRWELSLGPF